ncbi:TonB-dependent receptor [Klebsiella pneumoniae]|nr:TonB-dependent receptor [Klebsiella pneumoniae]
MDADLRDGGSYQYEQSAVRQSEYSGHLPVRGPQPDGADRPVRVRDQMEWDKWVMTLGGRYDYATTSSLTRATNSLAENHDQQFSWRGGINYLCTPDMGIDFMR